MDRRGCGFMCCLHLRMELRMFAQPGSWHAAARYQSTEIGNPWYRELATSSSSDVLIATMQIPSGQNAFFFLSSYLFSLFTNEGNTLKILHISIQAHYTGMNSDQ